MVAVVVATDLWVTVDLCLAGSLIFSVSAAIIAAIYVNFDHYMLEKRLVWAKRILQHLYRLSCGYTWQQRIARPWIILAMKCMDDK